MLRDPHEFQYRQRRPPCFGPHDGLRFAILAKVLPWLRKHRPAARGRSTARSGSCWTIAGGKSPQLRRDAAADQKIIDAIVGPRLPWQRGEIRSLRPVHSLLRVLAYNRRARLPQEFREEPDEEIRIAARRRDHGTRRDPGAGQETAGDRGQGAGQPVLRSDPPGLREVEQREQGRRIRVLLHRPRLDLGRGRRGADRAGHARRSEHRGDGDFAVQRQADRPDHQERQSARSR